MIMHSNGAKRIEDNVGVWYFGIFSAWRKQYKSRCHGALRHVALGYFGVMPMALAHLMPLSHLSGIVVYDDWNYIR